MRRLRGEGVGHGEGVQSGKGSEYLGFKDEQPAGSVKGVHVGRQSSFARCRAKPLQRSGFDNGVADVNGDSQSGRYRVGPFGQDKHRIEVMLGHFAPDDETDGAAVDVNIDQDIEFRSP